MATPYFVELQRILSFLILISPHPAAKENLSYNSFFGKHSTLLLNLYIKYTYLTINNHEFSTILFCLVMGFKSAGGVQITYQWLSTISEHKEKAFSKLLNLPKAFISSVFHIFSWNRLYQNAVLHICVYACTLIFQVAVDALRVKTHLVLIT